MQYLWLIWAIASLVSLLYGLTLTLGMGWATFIIDLLTQSVTTDYLHAQRSNPPSKNGDTKSRGILFIFLGLIFGYLAIKSL